MKKTSIYIAWSFVLYPGIIYAQIVQSTDIEQIGIGNNASIDQTLGQENLSVIFQSGNSNNAIVTQAGRNNRSTVRQSGNNNSATVDQAMQGNTYEVCLLYTSPSPRDQRGSRMPSSA